MNKKTIIAVVVSLAIVVCLYVAFTSKSMTAGSLSSCTDGYTCFTNTEIQGNLAVDATTTVFRTLLTTTSNTATSTIVAGCYQFYATSTATAQKFQASTTPGIMYSSYGTCPNL